MANEFSLTLDNEKLTELISTALLSQLDRETQLSLIQQSISYLVAPTKDSYNNGKSRLQLALNTALDRYALKFTTQFIENDTEIQTIIQTKLSVILPRLFDRDKFTTILTKCIAEAVVEFGNDSGG